MMTMRTNHFLLGAVLFIALPLSAQSWQDQAAAQNCNFDKLLIGTDKMITVQPPAGKVWILVAGSIALERTVPGATVVIWTETPPYAPYRNPLTGEMIGCARCVDLIHVDAGRDVLIPIVGGHMGRLRGQERPIVIAYPARLMIAVTPVHGGLDAPLQTWTRFTVVEKDQP